MSAERGCPDGLSCAHNCVASCWRVANSIPLSTANYRGGEWPAELIRRQLAEEQERGARLLTDLQTQGSRLRHQEEQREELERDVERARGIAVSLEQENAELERSLRWFRRGGEEYELHAEEQAEAPVARLRAMPEPAASLGAGPVYDLPDGPGLAELAQTTLDRLGALGDAFREAGPPEVREAMRALDHAAATGQFPEGYGPGDVPG